MPGEPLEVAAKPFNSSTVVVYWKPPSDDKQNGVIRAYQIYIQPKNSVRYCYCYTKVAIIKLAAFLVVNVI